MSRVAALAAAVAMTVTAAPAAHAATVVEGPWTLSYQAGGAAGAGVQLPDPFGMSSDGVMRMGEVVFTDAHPQPGANVVRVTPHDVVSPFVAVALCQDVNRDGMCRDVPTQPREEVSSACVPNHHSMQVSFLWQDVPLHVFVSAAQVCLTYFYWVPFVFPSGAGVAKEGTVTLDVLDDFQP